METDEREIIEVITNWPGEEMPTTYIRLIY